MSKHAWNVAGDRASAAKSNRKPTSYTGLGVTPKTFDDAHELQRVMSARLGSSVSIAFAVGEAIRERLVRERSLMAARFADQQEDGA